MCRLEQTLEIIGSRRLPDDPPPGEDFVREAVGLTALSVALDWKEGILDGSAAPHDVADIRARHERAGGPMAYRVLDRSLAMLGDLLGVTETRTLFRQEALDGFWRQIEVVADVRNGFHAGIRA